MLKIEGSAMLEKEIDRPAQADREAQPFNNEEAESIDLLALYEALRQGKRTLLLTAAVGFTLATIIAFVIPARYTSTASFIPPSVNTGNSMASVLSGQLSMLGGTDLFGMSRNSGDMYAGILQSRSIARDLVRRFDLMHVYGVRKESQAEKQLSAYTLIAVDNKSSIVTLSVRDKSPQRARDLAQAYMEALRDTNGRLALSQSSQRREFFAQQLEKEKDELENAEVDLKKMQEQSGLIAPTGQTEAEIKTFADLQAQIAVRQVQLAALRQSATGQNPDVIRLRSEIQDLEQQLAKLQKGSANTASITIPTAKVPAVELEYVRRQREVKYHEALFEMLSRQYEAARLDEAREAPIVQVLDEPSLPDTKSSPQRFLYMVGGLAAGILVGMVWILMRQRIPRFRPVKP